MSTLRRGLATLIIVITMLTLPLNMQAGAQLMSSPEGASPLVEVYRYVKIENGGMIHISDTFTLRAPEGEEVTVEEFWTGFKNLYSSESRSFYFPDLGKILEYDEELVGGFDGYAIEVQPSVQLQGATSLKIEASYLLVEKGYEVNGIYAMMLPVFPAIEYNISSFELMLELPLEAIYEDILSSFNFTHAIEDDVETIRYEAVGFGPMANENATFAYIPAPDDEYLLTCEQMIRNIKVSQGSLRVEDSYRIVNRDGAIRRFHLELPREASNLRAVDGVGPIDVEYDEPSEEDEILDVYVVPRSFMSSGYSWGFTVSYTVPKGNYVEGAGGSSFLTYPIYRTPHYIHDLKVKLTLPEGGSLASLNPEHSSTEKIGRTTVFTVELGAVLPDERPDVRAEYSLNPLAPLIGPAAIVFVVTAALGGVYFYQRRRPSIAKAEASVVVKKPKLKEYVDLYGERLSLLHEYLKMEQELEDSTLRKEDFELRNAEITRRQDEIVRSIRRLETEMLDSEPELTERIREVRKSEEELKRCGDDLRNLDVRLRARRVSRRDFQRRKQDRLQRMEWATKSIEESMTALRSAG